jgi:hypothetical protein
MIQKTRLPEDKAVAAADVVLGLLREKLPGPVATQLDDVIGGAGGVADKLRGTASGLAGMFRRS